MSIFSSKDSQLQQAISTVISHYQATSKSKKYSNLTPANASTIFRAINENKLKKSALVELISKKDYYTQKVHKILNESIKSSSSTIATPADIPTSSSFDAAKDAVPPPPPPKRNDLPPGATSTRSSRTNTIQSQLSTQLDSQYITNRYLADVYIRTRILTNRDKVAGLRQLIDQHHEYQRKMKQQRELLVAKFSHEKSQIEHQSVKLTKLSSTNQDLERGKLQQLTRSFEEELNKFHEMMMFELKKLSFDSENLLYEYRVPFFYINENYKYPGLNDDKVYVLDLLGDLLVKQ